MSAWHFTPPTAKVNASVTHTTQCFTGSGSLIKPSARAPPPRRFMSVKERQKYIYTNIYANEYLLPCYKRDGRSVIQWNCQELTVFSGPPWHIFEAAARNRLFLLIFLLNRHTENQNDFAMCQVSVKYMRGKNCFKCSNRAFIWT